MTPVAHARIAQPARLSDSHKGDRAKTHPPPGTHARLGRGLARWVREARAAGLDDESIESLLRVTLRAADEEEIA
jgi:hypothetical protein